MAPEGILMNWYKIAKSHEYSCVMLPLSHDVASAMLSFARDIPDDELADDGRESKPHVTILYGLHTEDIKDVKEALSGESEVKLTLGKVDIFPANENRNSDVLILKVQSEDLIRMNKKLSKLPNTNNYDDYKPHATLAYVKAGKGAKYKGKSVCSNTISRDTIEFSSKTGNKTKFKLGEK